MGHRSYQQCDWSTVEDDGRKVDSRQTRSSSGNPSVARIHRERITKQDMMSSVPRSDAQVAMQSKTTTEHRHTQIAAGRKSKNASEPLRMEQRGWRKKRSDRATEAVPETESAAPEPRENPIEPEANLKRRLLMKSASLTASGSGPQRQKRAIPDDESGMQVELATARRRLQHHMRISDGDFP